ncbi:hypothetical protein [Nocardia aurea]|uniref:hypothetical protein n=1 Tax=Nocardia aurea TaxID=2144174 RepID=UPI0033AA99D0
MTATLAAPKVAANLVTTMVCGCCTTPIHQIPADWHTARRILARKVAVTRQPGNRCDACTGHDVYRAPCEPADFEKPHCGCGCTD